MRRWLAVYVRVKNEVDAGLSSIIILIPSKQVLRESVSESCGKVYVPDFPKISDLLPVLIRP